MTYTHEEVADRLEINDTIIRYVHAIDDHQFDVLDTVFTSDCKFDFTSAGGPRGTWTELKTTVFETRRDRCSRDLHFYGMSRITFLDTQRSMAKVRSKVINPMGAMHNGREVFFQNHGTYDDLFVKLPEGWRIKERTWNLGWFSGDYHYEPPGNTMANAGKGSKADPPQ